MQNKSDSDPDHKFLWFALTLLLCLLLSAICAWFFGKALQAIYPEGILVFAESAGEEPQPSNAFFIGMAIGTFFCGLIYSALTVSVFQLDRKNSTTLQALFTALLFGSVSSLALCALCVVLAE